MSDGKLEEVRQNTLDKVKNQLKISGTYALVFLKWIAISVLVGILGGVIGSVFHIAVDYVTEFRMHHGFMILLLPLGGLAIAGMYHLFASKGKIDTNRVLESVKENGKVPLIMVPLIFLATVITHGLGGSAGREGAALQLGGGIGYNVGKALRLKDKGIRIVVMAGMSSVFAALFGTPLTAAVFSLEVTCVGAFHYLGLLPCVVASLTAFQVSQLFGIPPVRFSGILIEAVSLPLMAKVIVLALLCAVVSMLFCKSIHTCEHLMAKKIPNRYLRAVAGAVVIIFLTILVGSQDYNGAGMNIITYAISGQARPEAFLLKIVFTAITISAGFKGGEIVPAFFIGSTFGCVVGSLLGLDAGFAAAIGFVALFCGAVNCPLASIFLALEVFGAEGLAYFAVVCAVSYLMSGNFGLYHSQEIVFSKLDDEEVHAHTN
ncbi:MAG: chloride channel protein [Clostridia bacterium]|nr:chloride channel protein [Clostridia bacterium]